jgi:hypothetical protein
VNIGEQTPEQELLQLAASPNSTGIVLFAERAFCQSFAAITQ